MKKFKLLEPYDWGAIMGCAVCVLFKPHWSTPAIWAINFMIINAFMFKYRGRIKVKCEHLWEEYHDKISEPVEKLDDGYAINGCCGGGCLVITGIIYCPFCGEKIFHKNEKEKQD